MEPKFGKHGMTPADALNALKEALSAECSVESDFDAVDFSDVLPFQRGTFSDD